MSNIVVNAACLADSRRYSFLGPDITGLLWPDVFANVNHNPLAVYTQNLEFTQCGVLGVSLKTMVSGSLNLAHLKIRPKALSGLVQRHSRSSSQ